MRRRLAVLALAALGLGVGVGGLALREEIARLVAVNTLFAPEKIVENFSHMDALFRSVPMPAPTHVPSPLPRAPAPASLPAGFADWVAERHITSVVVLHRGEVAFEEYYLGTGPGDLRISWSMGKSVLAALFGISVLNGEIASIEDPVTKYAPALAGSAYEGVSIRNLLNMASGVAFDEDYDDFWSDINRMGRVVALGGSLDEFAAGIDSRAGAPGAAFRYVSIDTHVLGMVLRGATGRRIPALASERLFTPLRLEATPYYLTDSDANAFVLGGLGLTSRDYARFGQMVLEDGRVGGVEVVPEVWVAEMTAPSAPAAPGARDGGGYGYQWWIPPAGGRAEVFARGVYGQYIWIDRARDAVVVVTAADRGYRRAGVHRGNIDMLRAIVEAVQ